VNEQRIAPLPVSTGTVSYPPHLFEAFASLPVTTLVVDGQGLAERAGNAKAVNSVLLGVYARHMGFSPDAWHRAIEIAVPVKHRQPNLLAFDLGYADTGVNRQPSTEGQS
jgi:indolepyruvate ferredoxin oxidoreductase beta subunit